MDLRVRAAAQAGRLRVPVVATLVGTVPFGTWQFVLAATAAPGFFYVEQIVQQNDPLTGPGYAPASVTGGFDTSAAQVPVDVRIAADATFSAYATAVVQFADPSTPTAGLVVGTSTRPYDAAVRLVDGIGTAQAAIEAPGARAAGGDCLVRGACPVVTAVAAAAVIQSGAALTPAQLASAVAQAVNGNGISQVLSVSTVAARAAALLPTGTAVQFSNWTGTVYPSGGAPFAVSGTSGLSVATNWAVGLGPGAVAYYCDPEAVTASVTSL
jgi:hypothetical protein